MQKQKDFNFDEFMKVFLNKANWFRIKNVFTYVVPLFGSMGRIFVKELVLV